MSDALSKEAIDRLRAWLARHGFSEISETILALIAERERLTALPLAGDPLPSLRDLVRERSVDARRSALSLRQEVERGVTIRQSAESKLARADVLESFADSIDRMVAESDAPHDGNWFQAQFNDLSFCQSYIKQMHAEYERREHENAATRDLLTRVVAAAKDFRSLVDGYYDCIASDNVYDAIERYDAWKAGQ